jgi:hypothetical protein
MSISKFSKEEDYINYKCEEYNKKEDGRDDKWLENCKGDRTALYEPQFIELFEKIANSP